MSLVTVPNFSLLFLVGSNLSSEISMTSKFTVLFTVSHLWLVPRQKRWKRPASCRIQRASWYWQRATHVGDRWASLSSLLPLTPPKPWTLFDLLAGGCLRIACNKGQSQSQCVPGESKRVSLICFSWISHSYFPPNVVHRQTLARRQYLQPRIVIWNQEYDPQSSLSCSCPDTW